MKRNKLGMIFVLSGTMILASCSSAPSVSETKEYYLTFHQTEPGDIQDVVVTVIKGKTTNPEVWEQEPEINPKIVDFENGQNKIFKIKSGFTSIEVVDNEGLGGSKALKVSCSATNLNDAFLQAEKDYLDEVFKDPEVKSLSFYAKGSVATNNFRHIKVGTQYVGGNDRLIECYENNDSKYGMTNEYKKFYLTRNVYLQMFQSDNLNNTDYIIKYGKSGAAFDMYLDNFEMCYADYFEHKQNGLEFGGLDTSYNEASFKVYRL